ncbi:glycine cleavage system aminomethyltransferase GcvT [Burkholderia sp. Ac-20353]|uniref:glycine cleavage system aminomethyltransferase GcvT n=1 Tax=Burkholderia sp. Ac-20353 TaxID=2703894 RepID=UPI00197C5BE6|nr:glycine cleavage system aminomethyltransferase GcvT [Burkholderia sp. Ac-20353]MBN3786427.1 glycine cleavage system aminomethyltransferase GcvT [Burkholderia sp. Ac-20353]
MTDVTTASPLKKTPLYDLHRELGAKMVPFAGYEMPVQYPTGVLKEHLHTRAQAGLFDVSHMGQIRITGSNAAADFETLVPVDVIGLQPGRQRYAFFTNDSGGILDDLMVANAGDHLFVVVNAACKDQDFAWMVEKLDNCMVESLDDRALLALQGPEATTVLAQYAPQTAQMSFMDIGTFDIAGMTCAVSRSGYTGEDGFEISVAAANAESLALELLKNTAVAPIGLGARDSLRLEAGLCLYGHDMNFETSPVEASLVWAMSKVRRPGGERAGGFPGYPVIAAHLKVGAPKKRVGLVPTAGVPVRESAVLRDGDARVIGKVTSGGYGPSYGGPVAMGYVETSFAEPGTRLFAEVRGKDVEVVVTSTPFVPQRYYRG